jgi:lipoprotein-releasing system permease protein
MPHVTGAAPVVLGQGLVQSAETSAPIMIKGIVPDLETSVTNLGSATQAGSLAALTASTDTMAGIVVGRELASKLSVSVGDTVQVVTPEGRLSPLGLMPRFRTFKIVGIFSLGLFEFDSGYGFVHLTAAERLFDKARPEFIEVRVDDLFAARQIADSIPGMLGSDYIAQDWADMNKPLFSALWLEKMAISITIGLIVMVAALNIVASLILLVMEKSRDIAILKTMGCSAGSIRRIFMLQGLIIGIAGTAAGAAIGSALIYVLDRFRLISVPMDVYQISYVPFTLRPLEFTVVVCAAVLVCFLATIYPSNQAAKLDPAQALRYG